MKRKYKKKLDLIEEKISINFYILHSYQSYFKNVMIFIITPYRYKDVKRIPTITMRINLEEYIGKSDEFIKEQMQILLTQSKIQLKECLHDWNWWNQLVFGSILINRRNLGVEWRRAKENWVKSRNAVPTYSDPILCDLNRYIFNGFFDNVPYDELKCAFCGMAPGKDFWDLCKLIFDVFEWGNNLPVGWDKYIKNMRDDPRIYQIINSLKRYDIAEKIKKLYPMDDLIWKINEFVI